MTRPDALAPIVSITDPKAGTTRSSDTIAVSGYAMDDEGIVAIRVNGTDLLQDPSYASERGKRLVFFRFASRAQREGEVTSRIEVEDSSGRVTVLPYTLQIDATPPTLELSVTRLGNGLLRVQGVARDNNRVSRVVINGTPLQFVPAPEYAFAIDVDPATGNTIEVADSAGNRIEQPLQ